MTPSDPLLGWVRLTRVVVFGPQLGHPVPIVVSTPKRIASLDDKALSNPRPNPRPNPHPSFLDHRRFGVSRPVLPTQWRSRMLGLSTPGEGDMQGSWATAH